MQSSHDINISVSTIDKGFSRLGKTIKALHKELDKVNSADVIEKNRINSLCLMKCSEDALKMSYSLMNSGIKTKYGVILADISRLSE